MSRILPLLVLGACLSPVLAQAGRSEQRPNRADTYAFLLKTYDKDGDGHVSAAEYPRGKARFAELDRNADGVLDARDGASPPSRQDRRGERTGAGSAAKLEIGAAAPALTAHGLDGKTEFKLADWKGKKPVVLIFGSWT